MFQQTSLSALLLGAGAGLVGAVPAPWWFNDYHHHHHHASGASSAASAASGYPSFSFPSFPTGLTGSGIAAPTGFGLFPTGTGFAYPTGTGAFSTPIGSAPVAPVSASSASSYAVSAVEPTSSAVVASKDTDSTSSAAAATSSSAGAVSNASVTAASGCTFTDADAAIKGKSSCSSIVLSGITVPAGETLDMTDLADGTTLTFEGTTTFEYEEWEGPLISVSGKSITVQGASGHVIDGNGPKWWDGEGSNGGKTKPKFFYAHDLTDSVITGLNVLNTPVQGFSVNGASNLQLLDITIDNSAGDGDDGGHNTDAFDVGSSDGVYIRGANIKNQDDCLAINSGTNIEFTGGTCSGGHGLSIGSVGGRSDNDVANVYIADNTVTNSDQAVRIKTVYDATGSVKNVTYSGIKVSGIAKYGIVIEQDYENGSPTGTPTDGVPITDLTVENISGTVDSDADNVYILCAACSDWTWSGVTVSGGKTDSDCTGVPTGASC